MKKLLILTVALMVSACASMPTELELRTADYGRVIAQEECEKAVVTVMQGHLKDPMSAQYSYGTCEKRGLNSIPIMGIPKQFGYFIPVSINAKNSFGGYTGAKSYGFLLYNGAVIRKIRQDENGLMMPF